MSKLIEGEAIPVLEDVVVEEPKKKKRKRDLPDIGYESHVTHPGLREMYDVYREQFGALDKDERIAKLEEHFETSSILQNSLSDQQAKNLGYLTTIYALEKFWTGKGVTIKNLQFLNDVGLRDVNYALAGANGFSVERVASTGTYVFAEMENCTFGHVSAKRHFGSGAKNVQVDLLDGKSPFIFEGAENIEIQQAKGQNLGKLGKRSTGMRITKLEGKGVQIGWLSTNCSIEEVYGEFSSLLKEAQGAYVAKVEWVGDDFLEGSKDCEVEIVKKVGDRAFSGSSSCQVRKVFMAGDNFGDKSKDLVVKAVLESGREFGSHSNNLTVERVDKSGLMFGKGSNGLKVERVGGVAGYFASHSEEMEVGTIDKVQLDGLAVYSKNTKISEIERVEQVPGDYSPLNGSDGFTCLKAPAVLGRRKLHGTGYIIGLPSGYKTDVTASDMLGRIEKIFGEKRYQETMGLLNLGVEDE